MDVNKENFEETISGIEDILKKENPENLSEEATKKLEELYETIQKQIEQSQGLQYAELNDIVNNSKATNNPYEIVFDITAKVLQENEKGEIVSTKEIMTKNFFIPVPMEKDYNTFMGSFFSYLEKHILEAANQAYETEGQTNE